jgi:hypothetical protein
MANKVIENLETKRAENIALIAKGLLDDKVQTQDIITLVREVKNAGATIIKAQKAMNVLAKLAGEDLPF